MLENAWNYGIMDNAWNIFMQISFAEFVKLCLGLYLRGIRRPSNSFFAVRAT